MAASALRIHKAQNRPIAQNATHGKMHRLVKLLNLFAAASTKQQAHPDFFKE
jgi:hypothetical protein